MSSDSFLVIYQHLPRIDRKYFLYGLYRDLKECLDSPVPISITDNQVAFLMVAKERDRHEELRNLLYEYVRSNLQILDWSLEPFLEPEFPPNCHIWLWMWGQNPPHIRVTYSECKENTSETQGDISGRARRYHIRTLLPIRKLHVEIASTSHFQSKRTHPRSGMKLDRIVKLIISRFNNGKSRFLSIFAEGFDGQRFAATSFAESPFAVQYPAARGCSVRSDAKPFFVWLVTSNFEERISLTILMMPDIIPLDT